MEAAISGSRTLINEHYEILDTKHGLMLCNRHDIGMTATLEKDGAWAWEEIMSLQEHYKGVMLDIGANVGTHTLVYARTAEHVYAFEPQPHVYNNLCANLLLNNVLNVTTLKCALSSTEGHMLMKGFDPDATNCPAGAMLGRGDYKVPVRTLDSLVIPHVDFMKIDVECYEEEVLVGAIETIKRARPVIYVEVHSDILKKRVIALLKGLGYRAELWCHTDIVSNWDYPERIQFTEGVLFTCAH